MAKTATAPAAPKVVRLVFDKERKLQVRMKFVRQVLSEASRDVERDVILSDLFTQPMFGYPYLVKAMLAPKWIDKKPLTLDHASDLIDDYIDNGGSMDTLAAALMDAFKGYLNIEATPVDDEDVEGNSPTLAGTGSLADEG